MMQLSGGFSWDFMKWSMNFRVNTTWYSIYKGTKNLCILDLCASHQGCFSGTETLEVCR